MIAGISMGASILMAEYYGAKKYEDLKEEMATLNWRRTASYLVLSLLFYAGSGLLSVLHRHRRKSPIWRQDI